MPLVIFIALNLHSLQIEMILAVHVDQFWAVVLPRPDRRTIIHFQAGFVNHI